MAKLCQTALRRLAPHSLLVSQILLGGSWDLVSRVIGTLIGAISNYDYRYLTYNPSY